MCVSTNISIGMQADVYGGVQEVACIKVFLSTVKVPYIQSSCEKVERKRPDFRMARILQWECICHFMPAACLTVLQTSSDRAVNTGIEQCQQKTSCVCVCVSIRLESWA